MEKKVLREKVLSGISFKIPLKKSIFSKKKKTVMQFLNIQCISMTQKKPHEANFTRNI